MIQNVYYLFDTEWYQFNTVMQLKRWERKDCKPNSLPVLHKMHVKVGDTVKVIAGRDKGKTGEITRIFRHNSTVIVKDINLKTKHMKSREEGEPGQIVKVCMTLWEFKYIVSLCLIFQYFIIWTWNNLYNFHAKCTVTWVRSPQKTEHFCMLITNAQLEIFKCHNYDASDILG